MVFLWRSARNKVPKNVILIGSLLLVMCNHNPDWVMRLFYTQMMCCLVLSDLKQKQKSFL